MDKELSDYANYSTNNFNKYVDNLRKEWIVKLV